jgi:Peptidase inhibitor family I36
MRNMRQRLLPIAAATGLVVGLVGLAAPSADAATGKNGTVESGEFGLYWLTGSSGLVFDLYVSDTDFANDVFPANHSIRANDNTESYRNRDTYYWHVYTNKDGGGAHGCLPAGYVGNSSSTFTNTISSAYFKSTGC